MKKVLSSLKEFISDKLQYFIGAWILIVACLLTFLMPMEKSLRKPLPITAFNTICVGNIEYFAENAPKGSRAPQGAVINAQTKQPQSCS